jgi:hypothetical protein
VWITWNYYCKDKGIPFTITPELMRAMNVATNHHIKNNPHHPEYWVKDKSVNLVPITDRDKFDPTAMPTIKIDNMDLDYVVEMCADWCAMSEEKGTSPYDWASKVLGKRWQFNASTTKRIYEILGKMWI